MKGNTVNRDRTLPPSRAVVVGGSAGGFTALSALLGELPEAFALPILVVQHLHPSDQGDFADHLSRLIRLWVCVPSDKEIIKPGWVYVAPANYHMLMEKGGTIALSVDERVNWSRPSIDVLFESAALACEGRLTSVVLSGANADGAQGTRRVKAAGGLTMAQDPIEAEYRVMPQAAIDTGAVDLVLGARELGHRLIHLAGGSVGSPARPQETRLLR